MRIGRALSIVLLAVTLVVKAQTPDSLVMGERLRVRVAATSPRTTNVFVGNLASLSSDSLTLAIPGGKGSVILPRLAIAEVARSDGTEAHHPGLMVAPLIALTTFTAISSLRYAHSNGMRATGVALVGFSGFQVVRLVRGIPVERWRPLYSWLERP